MRFVDYKKIKHLHRVLLKRSGKGILFFLNIFFASILFLLIITLFSVFKTTTYEVSNQLIVFLLLIFLVGDFLNVLSIVNVETILSTRVIKNYPISNWTHLKVIYFCFIKHSRFLIYISPASYIGYMLLGSPLSFIIIILGVLVFYLIATLLLTLLFYFLDFIKYKYGIKNIALFFLPIFLLPAFIDSPAMFDNFLINFIYNFLLKLTE